MDLFFYYYYLFNNNMEDQNSQNERLLQARALAGQLGMFAEENEIPRDLWDALEKEIYNFYKVEKNS